MTPAHERAIMLQPSCVNGTVLIEVKCLYHNDTWIGVFDCNVNNAWWVTVNQMVNEHLKDTDNE